MIRKDSRIDLLIELLNEYEARRKDKDWRFQRTYKFDINIIRRTHTNLDNWWDTDFDNTNREIVSKSYWFIKWLWENGWIDYSEVIRKKWFWTLENEMISLDEQRYCEILMLLSISEDPIRLLIYILR